MKKKRDIIVKRRKKDKSVKNGSKKWIAKKTMRLEENISKR